MTATIIAITEHPRPTDLGIRTAEERGFGMAIKAMMDAVTAEKRETISKRELQFALLLLKPRQGS